jgi:uncharacterized membrane protein
MLHYLKLFPASMMIFFLLDMMWIGVIAKTMYIQSYTPWLRLENNQLTPIWWAILIVYFLFAFAALTFVLPLSKGQLPQNFFYGAAMGLVIYGVYDFTCLAIFKDWPVKMAFVDWGWGIFLFGFSSTLTAYLARFI